MGRSSSNRGVNPQAKQLLAMLCVKPCATQILAYSVLPVEYVQFGRSLCTPGRSDSDHTSGRGHQIGDVTLVDQE